MFQLTESKDRLISHMRLRGSSHPISMKPKSFLRLTFHRELHLSVRGPFAGEWQAIKLFTCMQRAKKNKIFVVHPGREAKSVWGFRSRLGGLRDRSLGITWISELGKILDASVSKA
jgi:hypothetical protein